VDKALQEFMPMKGLSFESKAIMQIVLCFVTGIGFMLYLYNTQTALNQAWSSAQN
jgi:hypothetical protein